MKRPYLIILKSKSGEVQKCILIAESICNAKIHAVARAKAALPTLAEQHHATFTIISCRPTKESNE